MLRSLLICATLLATACGPTRPAGTDDPDTTTDGNTTADAGTTGSDLSPVPAQEAIDTCHLACTVQKACNNEGSDTPASECEATCLAMSKRLLAKVFQSFYGCRTQSDCPSESTCMARTDLLYGDLARAPEHTAFATACAARVAECGTQLGDFNPDCAAARFHWHTQSRLDTCTTCLSVACDQIAYCWYGPTGCQ